MLQWVVTSPLGCVFVNLLDSNISMWGCFTDFATINYGLDRFVVVIVIDFVGCFEFGYSNSLIDLMRRL